MMITGWVLSDGLLPIFVLLTLMLMILLVWKWNTNRKLEKQIRLQEAKLKQNLALDESNLEEKLNEEMKIHRHSIMLMLMELEENKSKLNSFYENFGLSEIRFRMFAENFPGIVFECDLKGKINFLNNKTYHILGISHREIVAGKTVFDFLHEDDIERAHETLKTMAENKELDSGEYRIKKGNGDIIDVYIFIMPVFKEDTAIGFRGLLFDITRLRNSEYTLKIFEDIFSHMELGLNVYKYDADLEDFKLEIINPASEKMTRFSCFSNIGKSLTEISPLMQQQNFRQTFLQILKTGESAVIDDFIYQHETSGNPLILAMKIFPLPQSRVALLMENITSRRNTETFMKMNQFGMENAGDIILWINENGQLLYANQTACEKYGYSKQQLMSKSITDIDPRINKVQWFELIQILESKPSLTMESLNKSSWGDVFPVELSVNKFVYNNKKNYFVLVRDVSERKRNDELEQKVQVARNAAALKQQFLANMSHEIRTPMTGIMGMVSLLLNTQLDENQHEFVRNIRISSENLLNIINDVLDLSKIEAGKMELKPGKVELEQFVVQIADMYEHVARQKQIQFTYYVDPEIPWCILVDEHRLKQVVNNLLTNAFKFTDDGGIELVFSLVDKKDKTILIQGQVKDTGAGITPENQIRIFEKFTQISSSLVRPFEGTGLGLAICRELTQMMGGDIRVESNLGQGSTFIFTFQAQIDEKNIQPTQDQRKKEENYLGLRVLYAEDKLSNQKVVGLILANAGCQVDFVLNGKQAIEKYDPSLYDVILMDIEMPVMDGISAYKHLKEKYGETLCPVIGLSANALEGDAQKYLDEGLDDYIAKPFKAEYLFKKLNLWKNKTSKKE